MFSSPDGLKTSVWTGHINNHTMILTQDHGYDGVSEALHKPQAFSAPAVSRAHDTGHRSLHMRDVLHVDNGGMWVGQKEGRFLSQS